MLCEFEHLMQSCKNIAWLFKRPVAAVRQAVLKKSHEGSARGDAAQHAKLAIADLKVTYPHEPR